MITLKYDRVKEKLSKEPVFLIVAGFAGSGKTTLSKFLCEKLQIAMIDKDTVTEDFTNFILNNNNKTSGANDRESMFYKEKIRPIEYNICYKLCVENLHLGNSVVLSAPFISELNNYNEFYKELNTLGLDFNKIKLKVIFIKQNSEKERKQIIKRNEPRDLNKLENWDTYVKGIENFVPDINSYDVFMYSNSSIDDLLKWLEC